MCFTAAASTLLAFVIQCQDQRLSSTIMVPSSVPCSQDPEAAAGKYGFPVDNTIGETPQPNGWMDDWLEACVETSPLSQFCLMLAMSWGCSTSSAWEHQGSFAGPATRPAVRHGFVGFPSLVRLTYLVDPRSSSLSGGYGTS